MDNIVIYFTQRQVQAMCRVKMRHDLGGGNESLSSISSDGIPLSVNELPLKQLGDRIRLNVMAKTDGLYTLSLLETNSIPARYHVWLMDQLKKDSLDLSAHGGYNFNIVTADTTPYGKNRFAVNVRPQ